MANTNFGLPQGPDITGQATTNHSSGLAGAPRIASPSAGQQMLAALGNASAGVSGSGAIGAAIGTIGNLVGDAINYNRQKKMYETQRQDALEDYNIQRQDYLSDLASEREYNSPAAQRARLLEAGINPNVAFGNGNVANTSSNAENTSSIRSSLFTAPPTNSSLGTGIIASSANALQARQINSNLELQKAQLIKMLSETKGIDESTKRQAIENGWLDSLYALDAKEKFYGIEQTIDSMQTSAVNRLETLYRTYNLLPAQISNINAATQKLFSEIKSLNQQFSYFESVKETRKRAEYKDLIIKGLGEAESRYRSEIFKALSDRKDKNTIVGDFAWDSAYILKHIWSFK